jgi:hypothetical protein
MIPDQNFCQNPSIFFWPRQAGFELFPLKLAGVAIIVGGSSSQLGGLSTMAAARVTGDLLILIIVRILDVPSYFGSSC